LKKNISPLRRTPDGNDSPEGFLSQSCFCGKADGSRPLARNCSLLGKLSGYNAQPEMGPKQSLIYFSTTLFFADI
jgi:hypothetical protein